MNRLSEAPALAPALALLLGVGLEPHLTSAPRPWMLVGLAALAVASRRKWMLPLAMSALGLLLGVIDSRPGRELLERTEAARPVEAVVEVSASAQRSGDGWVAPARILSLRQGLEIGRGQTEVLLVLGGAEPPLAGSQLRVRGFLTRPSGFANPVTLEVTALPRLRVKSWGLAEVERAAGWLGRAQLALREQASEVGARSPGAALARALVLGDVRDISAETLRAFRRTGLIHVLSLSGLHVAALGGFVLLAASPLRRPGQRLLIAAILLAYVGLAGPFPALLRAVTMGLLAIAAPVLRRPPSALNALAVAAAAWVAFEPDLIRDLGFQLSCSATAGLILLTGPIGTRLGALPRPVGQAIGATLGAQLASFPWALPAFAMLSPIAPLVNLPAIPWAATFLPVSLIWFASAGICPSLAHAATPILDWLAKPVAGLLLLPSSAWVSCPWPAGPGDASVAALALLGLVLGSRCVRLWIVTLLALLLLEGGGRATETELEVTFFDVGQGDAILLRDGESTVLVDGGGSVGIDFGRRILAPNLASLGIRRLNWAILTHPDLDHCGGLLDLSWYLPIERLAVPIGLPASGCGEELTSRFGGAAAAFRAGDQLRVGRWRLRVLSPIPGRHLGGDNDRSLVLLAEGGGRSVLLAGDLEKAGERALAAAGSSLRCDVLKVGHHGGANSSSEEWLTALAPRLAVVSCGVRNRYGHPAAEVLSRLGAHGTRVLRTDRLGAITLRWRDGRPWRIETPCSPR